MATPSLMEGGTIQEGRKEEGHTLTDVRMRNTVVIRLTKRTLEPPNFKPNQRITAPSPCQNIGKRPLVLRTLSITRWKLAATDYVR